MIPKRFTLFGREFRVRWSANLLKERKYVGMVEYETGTIHLLPPWKYNCKVDKAYIERVFFHELSHIIDEETHGITKKEPRCETISGVVHEFLLSKTGDLYAVVH